MTPQPVDADMIETFLAQLDEAGDRLREMIEEGPPPEGPAIQYYLDGAAFVEAGYTMIEQLAERFPDVFMALYAHYDPIFTETRKGRIGWSEALSHLPPFLREYAQERVERDIIEDEEG